jgi:hypothetical protein
VPGVLRLTNYGAKGLRCPRQDVDLATGNVATEFRFLRVIPIIRVIWGAFFAPSHLPGVTPGRLIDRPEVWRVSGISPAQCATNQRIVGIVLLLTGIAVAALTIVRARGAAQLDAIDILIALCRERLPMRWPVSSRVRSREPTDSPYASGMPGTQRAKIRSVVLVALLAAACSPTRGCIESSFTLSPESRLPKWFASTGVPRAEATVTMDYWGGPIGSTATFILRDGRGRRVARIVGQLQGTEPLSLTPRGPTGPIPYPMYEVITVDGVIDVIEHRRMEDVFYVTDDPEVRAKLGVRD